MALVFCPSIFVSLIVDRREECIVGTFLLQRAVRAGPKVEGAAQVD